MEGQNKKKFFVFKSCYWEKERIMIVLEILYGYKEYLSNTFLLLNKYSNGLS